MELGTFPLYFEFIIFSTSLTLAFESACADLYFENNFFTTFAVFSSFVLAERIVPISMLNGPLVSASWSSLKAVILGGFTAFIVFIIPRRIAFITISRIDSIRM